jgi:hypothetical protein
MLEDLLFLELADFFFRKNFDLHLAYKQFRKSDENGFQNAVFSCVQDDQVFTAEVHLGVRIHAVEQLVQPFLDLLLDFRGEANTLLIPAGKLTGQKYLRFKAADEKDVKIIVEQIKELMNTTGFDFLAKASQINTLHEWFNCPPTLPNFYFHNQIHYCFKALAVAKLTQTSHFKELLETYTLWLTQCNPTQNTSDKFNLFVRYLQHSISSN